MEVMCSALDKPVFAPLAVASDDWAVVEAIRVWVVSPASRVGTTRCRLGPERGLRPSVPAPREVVDAAGEKLRQTWWEMELDRWEMELDRLMETYENEDEDGQHYGFLPERPRGTRARALRVPLRVTGAPAPVRKRGMLPRRRERLRAEGARERYRLADSRRRVRKARGVTRRTTADAQYGGA